MHRLTSVDAWVLLAIYRAGQQNKADYAAIVSCLPDVSLPIPTHQEFKTAYNKFLYIKFIIVEGANTSLAPAAQQLVDAAKPVSATGASAQAWVDAIANTLASYKCKSMCNRREWQEAQYLQGLELRDLELQDLELLNE
ncbi:MAG TPA: hypothetical protein DIW64_12005 [Cellvibrio sp.]|nr:hypothetical protein [Cellvibrio sp.]